MSAATGHARLSDEQRVFVSLDLCAAKVGTFSERGGTARAGGGGGGGGVCLWNLQTQGRTVMLHALSNKEFNGRHGVCGCLFPLKPRYAVTVRNANGKELALLVQIKNLRAGRERGGRDPAFKAPHESCPSCWFKS